MYKQMKYYWSNMYAQSPISGPWYASLRDYVETMGPFMHKRKWIKISNSPPPSVSSKSNSGDT